MSVDHIKEALANKPKRDAAVAALREKLCYDVTGQMDTAALTFDQHVQYSIALALKEISTAINESVRG